MKADQLVGVGMKINKSGHSRVAASLMAAVLLQTGILVGAPLLAQNTVHLRTGNDFLAGNSRSDDLYTGGIGLTIDFEQLRIHNARLGRGTLTFEENLFTDTEAGVRYDESWLLLGQRLTGSDWKLDLFGGAVRAGRGLAGENLQNALHRAIGDDEVTLEYVASNDHFPVLGFDFRKWFPMTSRHTLETRVDLRIAQGYQQWLELGAAWSWNATTWLELQAMLGVRASWAEYDVVEPWIESLAPSVEIGVVLCDQILFSWTNNEYGTGMGHLTLGYRLPLERARRTGSWRLSERQRLEWSPGSPSGP